MRIITTLLIAFFSLSALTTVAQDSQKSKNRIAYIRKVYKEAQENAQKSADNMLTVIQREKSDDGLFTTTLDFFYVTDIVEVVEIPYYKLNLLRRTQKGANNQYEEFLYDPSSEDLIFYFTSFEYEKGVKCETRLYIGASDDGTALKVTKFTDTKTGKDVSSRYPDSLGMFWDEGFMLRFAHDMQEAFNHLTLRGWD